MPEYPLIRTLTVEPDPVLGTVQDAAVNSTAGFTVRGTAHSCAEMLHKVRPDAPEPFDLVLLDPDLPDVSGLEVCRRLRAQNPAVDIVVATAARDRELVRGTAAFGVLYYLVKPFTQETLRDHLQAYAAFRRRTADFPAEVTQADIDSALGLLRPAITGDLVPERSASIRTLDVVAGQLRVAAEPLSADEVAGALGISRVTARRYLEELTGRGLVSQTQRYGSSGRPRNVYRWR